MLGSFEATRFATGRKNALSIEVSGDKGALAFDLKDLNSLWFYDRMAPNQLQGFTKILVTESEHPYISAWWPAGHMLGYEHGFSHQVKDLLRPSGPASIRIRRSPRASRCSECSRRSSRARPTTARGSASRPTHWRTRRRGASRPDRWARHPETPCEGLLRPLTLRVLRGSDGVGRGLASPPCRSSPSSPSPEACTRPRRPPCSCARSCRDSPPPCARARATTSRSRRTSSSSRRSGASSRAR